MLELQNKKQDIERELRSTLHASRFTLHGFTLIELLLTIIVISSGMLGIMALFENATRGALESDMSVVAANLGREKMELVIVGKVANGYAALNAASYPDTPFTGDLSPFTRNTTVTEVAGNDLTTAEPGSGYKRVEVTVSWGPAGAKKVIVPTILANY